MGTSGTEAAYRTRVDPRGDVDLTVALVEALAAAEDVDPTEVDFRLYDSIDVEALGRLLGSHGARTGSSWRTEFAVDDRLVVVRSDGHITVR